MIALFYSTPLYLLYSILTFQSLHAFLIQCIVANDHLAGHIEYWRDGVKVYLQHTDSIVT